MNADGVEVVMAPEEDGEVNPLGIEGIGEIGIVETSAALANVVDPSRASQVSRDLPSNRSSSATATTRCD